MHTAIIQHFQQLQAYEPICEQMLQFTKNRTENTKDQLWFLQHTPVYTQGQAGKAEHILKPGNIPVVQTDRGGQVTYHGPGQLVVYILYDLKRSKIGIRDLVCKLEQSVIKYLATLNIEAHGKREAPGVYVEGAKICSIGLRVKKGATYHGIAFNINMDINPFYGINPCGYKGLQICQLKDFINEDADILQVKKNYIPFILSELNLRCEDERFAA